MQSKIAILAAAAVTAAGAALAAGVGGYGSSAAHRCTKTFGDGSSVGAIEAALTHAPDGSVICLRSGTYPFIHVSGANHSSYVTLRPAAKAHVVVAGIEVQDSSFLRFQGLDMSEGINLRDQAGYPGSHDYQIIGNRFANALYGVVLYGGSGPVKRVAIEHNYMRHVRLERPESGGVCRPGYADGQDVTLYYAEGVRIAYNTFNEAEWHYIQGGSAGPEGAVVEHNLFEGRVLLACSHLNLWQVWDGGQNDTFRDNVAIGAGRGEWRPGLSEEAATDGVLFENGPGSLDCSTTMSNTVIEGNLFLNAATSYEIQVYTTSGATIRNNTVVGSEYGSALLTEHCGPGSGYTMTHNVDVENLSRSADFMFGDCTGSCTFDFNVSEDGTARQAGARHAVTHWRPRWRRTSWSRRGSMPRGFYAARAVPFPAGRSPDAGP